MACKFSTQKYTHSLMGLPLYVKSHLSWQFDYNVSHCGFLWLHIIGDPLGFLDMYVHFFL